MTVFTRNGKSILYIHVPKTGGTAIEFAFRDAGWQLWHRDGNGGKYAPNWFRLSSPQHMDSEQLAAVFRLDRFDGIFMTVRDPIARLRSEYLMRHRQGAVDLSARAVEQWAFGRIAAYRRDPYIHDNHLRPQSEFFVPGALVYRVEDGLDFMMSDVGAAFEIDVPASVDRVNEGITSSGASSHDVEISARLESALRSWYQKDFAMFGYP